MPTVKLLLASPYEKTKNGTKKPTDKETRIYAYLILSREAIVKIKTEHVIKPTEWDFDKQLKKERLAGAIEYNRRLLTLKDEILDKYHELKKDPTGYGFDHIKKLLQEFGKTKENPYLVKKKSFFDVYEEFVEKESMRLAPRTIQKFGTLKNVLKELTEADPKYKYLTFDMIDFNFMDDFKYYLWSREPRGRQKRRPEGMQNGLLVDSVGKYVENLRSFLKWAYQRKYHTNKMYESFKMFADDEKEKRKQNEENISLTIQELRDLYTHEFPKGSTLDNVRDLFCFAAYTGQRFQDVLNFNKSDLYDDVWTFRANKTKKATSIDLIGYARPAYTILEKHKFELPKISSQKCNEFIKQACSAAGIIEPVTIIRYTRNQEIKITGPKSDFVTFHTARRTCVSLLLNNYGVPISTVMQITKHSSLNTLQKYLIPDRKEQRAKMASTTPVTEPLTVKKNVV